MHAPTFSRYRHLPAATPRVSARKSWWQRLMAYFVMDGPAWWDMHPDVLRKIEEDKRAARN